MGLKSSKPTPSAPTVQRYDPGPVEDLEVEADPTRPSITLRWRPPNNLGEIQPLHSHAGPEFAFLVHVTEVGSSAVVDETRIRWDSSFRPVTFTYTKSILAPLKEYSFKVQVDRNKELGVPVCGEPRCVQQFFNWKCRHPNCSRSRRRLPHPNQREIYDFCCREHKDSFDDRYCLYPECTCAKSSASEKTKSECNSLYSFRSLVYQILGKTILTFFVSVLAYSYFFSGSASIKLAEILLYILVLVLFVGFCVFCVLREILHHKSFGHTPKRKHFCSEHQAIMDSSTSTLGMGYFVHVKPSSWEFKEVKLKFDNTWCNKKGRRPTVFTILAVVNPVIGRAFDTYKNSLPSLYVCSEMYFHGTRLTCHINECQTPCSSADCSVCSIAKYGFRQLCIRRDGYQRFGRGFYLAPNSSKSCDYCSSVNLDYTAMLLCEVAPGNKYFLRRSLTTLQGPPQGYHSVYGKSKFLFIKGDLNYDEIVVFKSEAICPRYVLLFK